MDNPQLENGYTKLADEVLENLIKSELSGSEFRIVLFVIRKTYGFNKKEDSISLSQFQKGTCLTRTTISHSLQNLVNMAILVKTAIPYQATFYKFNKYAESWRVVKHARLVKWKRGGSKDLIMEVVKPAIPTIDNTKYNITTRDITRAGAHDADNNGLETKNNLPKGFQDEVNLILEMFYKSINPNINFANKLNRDAVKWLLEKNGFEKVEQFVRAAISVFGKPYAPVITTPYQLKEKLSSLQAYITSHEEREGRIIKL